MLFLPLRQPRADYDLRLRFGKGVPRFYVFSAAL